MSDFAMTWLLFALAVNPLAVLTTVLRARDSRLQPTSAAIALLASGALLLAATLASGEILDSLSLEPETFRISAGAILVATGIAFVLFGPFSYPIEPGWKGALFPLAFPLLAGPAALATAITRAADHGNGEMIAVALIVTAAVLAFVWALSGRSSWAWWIGILARLLGAVLVVSAVGLIIDGVRSV